MPIQIGWMEGEASNIRRYPASFATNEQILTTDLFQIHMICIQPTFLLTLLYLANDGTMHPATQPFNQFAELESHDRIFLDHPASRGFISWTMTKASFGEA